MSEESRSTAAVDAAAADQSSVPGSAWSASTPCPLNRGGVAGKDPVLAVTPPRRPGHPGPYDPMTPAGKSGKPGQLGAKVCTWSPVDRLLKYGTPWSPPPVAQKEPLVRLSSEATPCPGTKPPETWSPVDRLLKYGTPWSPPVAQKEPVMRQASDAPRLSGEKPVRCDRS